MGKFSQPRKKEKIKAMVGLVHSEVLLLTDFILDAIYLFAVSGPGGALL